MMCRRSVLVCVCVCLFVFNNCDTRIALLYQIHLFPVTKPAEFGDVFERLSKEE